MRAICLDREPETTLGNDESRDEYSVGLAVWD